MGDKMITKARVLILDDEEIVGERLKISLEKAGFAVEAFSTSQDAINRLKVECFDILVNFNGNGNIWLFSRNKRS